MSIYYFVLFPTCCSKIMQNRPDQKRQWINSPRLNQPRQLTRFLGQASPASSEPGLRGSSLALLEIVELPSNYHFPDPETEGLCIYIYTICIYIYTHIHRLLIFIHHPVTSNHPDVHIVLPLMEFQKGA